MKEKSAYSLFKKSTIIVALLIIAIAFIIGLKIRTMVPGNGLYWMNDYQVFYEGGRAVLTGNSASLYDFRTMPYNYRFPYSPFSALLFVPMALVPLPIGHIIWFVANIVEIAVCCWVCFRLMGIPNGKTSIIAAIVVACCSILLDPVLDNQMFGTVNVLLMFLVCIDFAPALPPRLRGIFTGIAAGIKLTPLFFILFMFLTGKKRAAITGVCTYIGTLILGWIFIPGLFDVYLLKGQFWYAAILGLTQTDVMHSLFGFFARTAGTPTIPPPIAYIFVAIFGLFGLYMGCLAKRQGHDLLALVLIADTALLISPVTWMATMVWIVPSLIWLGLATWRHLTKLPYIFGFILVLWFTIPVYWFAQRVGDAIPYQTTLPGNLLATLGSPMFPLLVAILLSPLWIKYLAPSINKIAEKANKSLEGSPVN